MEPSYAVCESLSFGRMSFKGANPEIEKLMRRFQDPAAPTENPVLKEEMYADVRADEVAKTMSLTKTISRKFAKRPPNRGFKRPAED